MTTPDAVWRAPATAAEEFDRLRAQSVPDDTLSQTQTPAAPGTDGTAVTDDPKDSNATPSVNTWMVDNP